MIAFKILLLLLVLLLLLGAAHTSSFMTNITLPGNQGGLDLAAVDILRDRERGVPRCACCAVGLGTCSCS